MLPLIQSPVLQLVYKRKLVTWRLLAALLPTESKDVLLRPEKVYPNSLCGHFFGEVGY